MSQSVVRGTAGAAVVARSMGVLEEAAAESELERLRAENACLKRAIMALSDGYLWLNDKTRSSPESRPERAQARRKRFPFSLPALLRCPPKESRRSA